MLEYNRIDLSEGIDVNKTSNSGEFWRTVIIIIIF